MHAFKAAYFKWLPVQCCPLGLVLIDRWGKQCWCCCAHTNKWYFGFGFILKKKKCSLSCRLDAVDKSIDQILAWMCSVWQHGEAAIIYRHVCRLCPQTCAITKWTKSIRHQTRLHQKGFFTSSTGHIYKNNISQSVFYTLCCWGRLYGRDFRVMTIVPWLLHAELLFRLPSILIHLPAASRSSYLAPGEYHFCCRLGPPFKVIHTSCSE